MCASIKANASVNSNWNGMPVTLKVDDSVSMPQTPDGSLIFGYFNVSQQVSQGALTLTSGGEQPTSLPVPALLRMISILVKNWGANNLTVTNVSENSATPITVEAFGPGVPGVQPTRLVVGTPVQLAMRQSAQGTSLPRSMQLRLRANSSDLEIAAIVGGPTDASGNNAYVIALNASETTGPPTQKPPLQEGYYATTMGNTYDLRFNWGAASIYVANLSPQTAMPMTVLLQSL